MTYETAHFTRRTFGLATLAAASAGVAALPAKAQSGAAAQTIIHRVEQTTGFPVNAYIVEGPEGLVVVDATLTQTASLGLRGRVDAIDKPLQGVLLTHPHPDHYAGLGNLTQGLDVPIYSVPGVNDVVRRDDDAKNALISGMFGPEWPSNRVFPTDTVTEGNSLDFGPGLKFNVMDIGPGESFHDSVFLLDGAAPTAFVGDLVFTLMHAYLADAQNQGWLAALDRLRSDLAEETLLYVGHGAPTTPALIDWQRSYIEIFDAAIAGADWADPDAATASVMAAMSDYLPSEALAFLLQLSIAPNAQAAGKL